MHLISEDWCSSVVHHEACYNVSCRLEMHMHSFSVDMCSCWCLELGLSIFLNEMSFAIVGTLWNLCVILFDAVLLCFDALWICFDCMLFLLMVIFLINFTPFQLATNFFFILWVLMPLQKKFYFLNSVVFVSSALHAGIYLSIYVWKFFVHLGNVWMLRCLGVFFRWVVLSRPPPLVFGFKYFSDPASKLLIWNISNPCLTTIPHKGKLHTSLKPM